MYQMCLPFVICEYDDYYHPYHIINHQHYDHDHDDHYDYDDTDDNAGTKCPMFLPLRAKQLARRLT